MVDTIKQSEEVFFTFETPSTPIETLEELDIQAMIDSNRLHTRIKLQGVLAPTNPNIFYFTGIINDRDLINGVADISRSRGLFQLAGEPLKDDEFAKIVFANNKKNGNVTTLIERTLVNNEESAYQLADAINLYFLGRGKAVFFNADPDVNVIASTLWMQNQQTRQHEGYTIRGNRIQTLDSQN